MTFSNKRKPDNQKSEKRRSLLGSLLVPNVRDSISPIGKSLSSFVKMIAMIFAMNGLFPKDHPALKQEGEATLNLSQVLETAWSGLSFTKQGVPKVLLFFSVILAIVLTILSVITAIMLGFVSHAHAQVASTSVFSVPTANTKSDLASNWLTFLFDPSSSNSATALANIGQTTGVMMPSTVVQQALTTALGVYSNAMLIVAGFILFYHLAAMVVETAHHGVPMGKRANQIWAPIRLVVAIGLLVPVSSSLNSGQYIVLKVAQMGSALASNVWKTFVTTLTQDAKMPALVSPTDGLGTMYNLTMMFACEYAYNYQIYSSSQIVSGLNNPINYVLGGGGQGWSFDGTGTLLAPNGYVETSPPSVGPEGEPIPAIYTTSAANPGSQINTPGKYTFTNGVAADYDMCGSYTIPPPPTMSDPNLQTLAQKIYTDTVNVFISDSQNAEKTALKIQNFMVIDKQDIHPPLQDNPVPLDIILLAAKFQTDLASKVQGDVNASALSSVFASLSSNSESEGWISAGAWFNKLSSDQAELSAVVSQSIPTTAAPNITPGGGPAAEPFEKHFYYDGGVQNTLQSSYQSTLMSLKAFSKHITGGYSPTTSSAIGSGAGGAPGTATAVSLPSGATIFTPIGCILVLTNYVANLNNVWQQSNSTGGTAGAAAGTSLNNAGIGVQFTTSNPLLEMAAWGHNNIAAGITMFNLGVGAAALNGVVGAALSVVTAAAGVALAPESGGLTLGLVLGAAGLAIVAAAGTMIAGFLFMIGTIFFTMGATMAYVVPLLPFIHFFFNTITWVTCVAESIVGVPLIALAHLHPEGDGLPGNAKNAYFMIFSVFLRPVMMIFGLICGLLTLFVAVGLLNALYAFAVSGGGGAATAAGTGSHLVISRMMYSVMYVFILYSIANHAFAMISTFPSKAMEWFGQRGLGGEKMGDPAHIGTGVAGATGLLTNQAAGQLQAGSKAFGDQMGGALKSGYDNKKKNLEKEKTQGLIDQADSPTAKLLAAQGYSEDSRVKPDSSVGRLSSSSNSQPSSQNSPGTSGTGVASPIIVKGEQGAKGEEGRKGDTGKDKTDDNKPPNNNVNNIGPNNKK